MRWWNAGPALVIVPALAMLALWAPRLRAADQPDRLKDLAARAVSGDSNEARQAITELRAAGPVGLKALMDANAGPIRRRGDGKVGETDPDWPRVAVAIDAVAAQKDAYASGLYWYTDFDAARKAARESGKPILSLRLLGTLDAEYSCANSRFFRTVLYANRDVSAALSDRFVLHWKSVRPVPKITIDFGDGRKVERTITGNSIHYVLDADGNAIDAIPGLYGPRAFLDRLNEAARVEREARAMAAAERGLFLRGWHTGRAEKLLRDWQADLQRAGVSAASGVTLTPLTVKPEGTVLLQPNGLTPPVDEQRQFPLLSAGVQPANPPTALSAAPLAIGKGTVEMNVVRSLSPTAPPPAAVAGPVATGKWQAEAPIVIALAHDDIFGAKADAVSPAGPPAPPTAARAARLATSKLGVETRLVAALSPDPAALAAATDDAAWKAVAALHADEARLDESSKALMAAKNPAVIEADGLTESEGQAEAALLRMVRNFERSVAEDTVRNEYTFHRTIHAWLAAAPGTPEAALAGDVNALNERVYAELFLTPSSDPWLGLLPPDTYSALENDGVCPTK